MIDTGKAQSSLRISPAPRATAHGDCKVRKAPPTQLNDSRAVTEDEFLNCWQSPGNFNSSIDAWSTIAARARQLIKC